MIWSMLLANLVRLFILLRFAFSTLLKMAAVKFAWEHKLFGVLWIAAIIILILLKKKLEDK